MSATVASRRGTPTRRLFSPRALTYFAEHAIDPLLALSAGVRERGGSLVFRCVDPNGERHERLRDLRPGARVKVRGLKGVPLFCWWLDGRVPVDGRAVLLCEGESDALAALTALARRAGVLRLDVVVVAVPSCGCPPRQIRDELLQLGAREAILAFDGDRAGRAYTVKVANTLAEAGLAVLSIPLPGDMDLASYLVSRGDGGESLTALFFAARPVT